jgi:hypothetical protein
MVMLIIQREFALGAIKRHYIPTPEVKKLSFITVLGYHTAIYFTKFSILAFYSNLFPSSSPRLRKMCYAVIGYTILSYITAMFLAIFWCGSRPSRHWDDGSSGCSLWDYKLFKINFAMNISSDVFIFLLPFPVIATLTLSTRQIVALCVTFGLGLITIAVSMGRCLALLQNAFVSLYVWSMAEMCTAIMVVSLPSLRPLLRKHHSSANSSSLAASSPRKSGEKPIGRPMNRARNSVNGSRHGMSRVHNSGDPDSSDLELINVTTKPKDAWKVEDVEVHPSQQQQASRHIPRRMASFDSRTPPERSKEWV